VKAHRIVNSRWVWLITLRLLVLTAQSIDSPSIGCVGVAGSVALLEALISKPARALMQDESDHPIIPTLRMIDAMSCEADEQFAPLTLSFDQRDVIAWFEAIALTQGVQDLPTTAHAVSPNPFP
jgi:hypothetical protein